MLGPYQLQETDDFSYVFTSAQGIIYHVYFLDYSYMFQEYPHIAEDVYSFKIDVIDGETFFAAADERMGLTIVEVFKAFFKRRQNVAVYVCDNADDRHYGTQKKI